MPELREFYLSCNFEIRIRKYGTSFGMLRKILQFLSSVSKERDCPIFSAIITDSKGSTTLWTFDKTGVLYQGYDECIRNINLDANGELSSQITFGVRVLANDLK